MQQTKLLHILYSGQGGLGTYFMNFVNSDKNKAFDHYAFFYGIEPLNEELKSFCEQQQISYTYQPKKEKFDIAAIKKVLAFRKQHQIKYLLLHTFSLSLITLIARIKKFRVIAIDHTPYQVKTTIEQFFTLINHLLAFKMIYFYKGHFEQIQRLFPFLRFGQNSHIIPKTVDIHFFKLANNRPVHTHFTLGITARLIQGKRHDLLIKAIKQLKEQGQTIHLKIAGAGPKEKELKEMVKAYQLVNEVTFAGLLNRSELLSFYQSLDAYIHASEGETICYSIMEAQACGLPILASDVEGINNYLEDGIDALLFQNKVERLIAVIALWLQAPKSTLTYAQQSRLRIEKKYAYQNNPGMLKSLIVS